MTTAVSVNNPFVCVSGFIWAEIKEMWDGGFTEYIHDWWNLMDFAMNSLYLATISLKIVAYVKVKMAAAASVGYIWPPSAPQTSTFSPSCATDLNLV